MSIISKYIMRLHIAPFLMGTFTVLFLFIFQFILKNIDKLVGKGLDEWVIIQLIVLNIAWMLVLAVPMGVLFSTLMSFGSMAQSHEVTVIKSSGGSLLRMMNPVIIAGILITLLLFWFNDYILPDSNHRAKSLMQDIRRTKPTFTIESGNYAMDLEGYTIISRQVDSLNGTLKGVTIYDTRGVKPQNIISADTGIVKFSADMSKLMLTLFSGEIVQVQPSSVDNFRKILFKEYEILIDARGFTFERSDEEFSSRGDREMRIADMERIASQARASADESAQKIKIEIEKHYDYLSGKEPKEISTKDMIPHFDHRINKIKFDTIHKDSIKIIDLETALENAEKRISFLWSTINSDSSREQDLILRAKRYDVEIYKKYAIPMACLVFVFVGCPLGIATKGGSFGTSAAISLGFYIIYWACLIGGEKLADRGIISPFISMFAGNIIVGLMGLMLTIRINNESFRLPFFKRKSKYNASPENHNSQQSSD